MNRPLIAVLVRPILFGIAAFMMLSLNPAIAADSSGYTTVDDTLVYYAVVPAEMVRKYRPGSPEAEMHGGVPAGKHVHHIQIAPFDAKTFERIADARVTATISELGLGEKKIVLEPFSVGEALTYGGYFEFSKLGRYTIDVRIERPGAARPIHTRFDYQHH